MEMAELLKEELEVKIEKISKAAKEVQEKINICDKDLMKEKEEAIRRFDKAKDSMQRNMEEVKDMMSKDINTMKEQKKILEEIGDADNNNILEKENSYEMIREKLEITENVRKYFSGRKTYEYPEYIIKKEIHLGTVRYGTINVDLKRK